MADFVAVLHANFSHTDEIEARLFAEDLREGLDKLMETDDGDGADVIEVISADEDPAPISNVIQLKRARNILLRTRTTDGWDLARTLDQFTHAYEHKYTMQDGMISYDYGKFIDTAKAVIDGGNPLT